MENTEEKQLSESNVRVQVVKKNVTKPVKLIDLFPQLLASTVMYLPVIQAGINMSFASVLISQLADSNEILIDTNRASIIASIWPIALPLGAISSGFLCDKFGRKKIGIVIW